MDVQAAHEAETIAAAHFADLLAHGTLDLHPCTDAVVVAHRAHGVELDPIVVVAIIHVRGAPHDHVQETIVVDVADRAVVHRYRRWREGHIPVVHHDHVPSAEHIQPAIVIEIVRHMFDVGVVHRIETRSSGNIGEDAVAIVADELVAAIGEAEGAHHDVQIAIVVIVAPRGRPGL